MFYDRLLSFFSDTCVQTVCGHWYCSKVDAGSKLAAPLRDFAVFRHSTDSESIAMIFILWFILLPATLQCGGKRVGN